MFLRRERDVWDQLRQQKELLAGANELLSARSVEVEDLRLRCADMKAEAATAREQVAPLAARVKELGEELTRAAGERDVLLSWADEALKAAEASRVDALAWKEKYEGELCSLYFACFFLRSAPNSPMWYRA